MSIFLDSFDIIFIWEDHVYKILYRCHMVGAYLGDIGDGQALSLPHWSAGSLNTSSSSQSSSSVYRIKNNQHL